MNNILKITSTPEKNMFGKKNGKFIAKLGETGWIAIGSNKEDALAKLEKSLTNAETNMFARSYIRKGNVTFALFYARGWGYDIVRNDGRASTCMLGDDVKSSTAAREIMQRHSEQHDGE